MEHIQLGVSAIINTNSLIINAGRNQNIQIGQKIRVLDSKAGVTIKDPFTGEKIGEFPAVKKTLIVQRVQPGYSICTTIPHSLNFSGNSSLFEAMNKKVYPEFQHKGELIGEKIKESNSPIQVGDLVELIYN